MGLLALSSMNDVFKSEVMLEGVRPEGAATVDEDFLGGGFL